MIAPLRLEREVGEINVRQPLTGGKPDLEQVIIAVEELEGPRHARHVDRPASFPIETDRFSHRSSDVEDELALRRKANAVRAGRFVTNRLATDDELDSVALKRFDSSSVAHPCQDIRGVVCRGLQWPRPTKRDPQGRNATKT